MTTYGERKRGCTAMGSSVDRMEDELRALSLVEARRAGERLYAEIAARGLVVAGTSARELSDRIRDLGAALLGPRRIAPVPRPSDPPDAAGAAAPAVPVPVGLPRWVVRSGPDTVTIDGGAPAADRPIAESDVVCVDLGRLLGAYEGGFARTFVLGANPARLALLRDLPAVHAAGREAYRRDPGLTGRGLYEVVAARAAEAGWELGGPHVGHLVGEPAYGGGPEGAYLWPENDGPLRCRDGAGRRAHWVLDVHLVARDGGFGGVHRDLLDLV
ncbi:M24 family metallopeptidase (plasmid) [Streptomyces sp. BI20]|uniref:M24 family metallopeptidase n=1 Tax=Streptomyces sp. BI20 TaxID=3403460 RepID=UPI003C7065EB